jgi:aspartate 1-decarboxylase
MLRTMCRAKIHRATINEADLHYVGSMTVPRDLMETLDILEGEQCDVLNINNGARWTTYAIAGEKPNHFCLNGAAARLGGPGDLIIIMFYAQMDDAEARQHRPKIAVMSPDNTVEQLLPTG